MHDLEFDHLHVAGDEINETAWSADNVELTTVGIDIGSSTTHLMFARVHLQRLTTALSSRFVVVNRKMLWQSPILLTPYLPDYTIDTDELGSFLGGWGAGRLYDIQGNYDLMWWISIGLGLFAAGIHWRIRERQVPRLLTAAAPA